MGYDLMKTEQLVDELERLKQRVRARDEKMGKRLKNPLCHAHPCQFWPLCAEAYKLSSWNHFTYFRWQDWVMIPTMSVASAGMYVTMIQYFNNGQGYYRNIRNGKYMAASLGFMAMYLQRSHMVEQRMYGLDENHEEIEQYGPMYPEQIEEAAYRKKKYEQEYIRIKEGLFDQKQITQRIDNNNSYFYDTAGSMQSGYFNEQTAKRSALKERHDSLQAQTA